MLMGEKVFDGSDTFPVSYAHVHEAVPDLPAEKAKYQSLLNKLLAKNPDDRFQSTTQLIAQLKKYLRRLKPMNDTTHSFAPLPELTNLQKKSNPIPFIITGVIVVAAVLFGIWFMDRNKDSIDVNLAELTPAQKIEMSQKLAAANSFFNLENFETAEEHYIEVLTNYNCKEEDARGRLKVINPEKLQQIIDACD